MSIATKVRDALDALSPSDPVLVEKTLSRLSEQDTWNDVFSTKLIHVLDNIDQLKAELRQSSRMTEQRGADAEKNFDESAARLKQACETEERATDLLRKADSSLQASEAALKAALERTKSVEDVLAKAFTLASEAGTRDARALVHLRTAARWAIAAISFSWVGLVWVAWAMFRYVMPIWTAYTATALIVASAVFFWKRKSHEG